MQVKFPYILLIYIFSFVFSNCYARDFTNIDLITVPVNKNIYMLEGVGGFAGGNIAVSIGNDGILIVDDQFSEMSGKIREKLTELNAGPLRFILNTHWHGDHTGGNAIFSKQATIIAHENVRNRLMNEQINSFGTTPAQPRESWPVITFANSVKIYFNNETINIVHYPHGHTDGDSVVYFKESNVVHMGDHFFSGMFPFIDLDSGGNVLNFAENIESIIKALSDDVKIIPGHGPLSNINDLKSYHKMLVESIEFVTSKIGVGMSLDEIQKIGLPGHIQKWEKGFITSDRWIMSVFRSIQTN